MVLKYRYRGRSKDWHRVNRKPIKTKATPINTISTKKEEGGICTRYRKISFEYGRTKGQTDGRTSIWSIQTFIGIFQSAIILQDIMARVSEAIKSNLKILFFLPRYGGYWEGQNKPYTFAFFTRNFEIVAVSSSKKGNKRKQVLKEITAKIWYGF